MSPSPSPLRVLGWPAFANRAEQPYSALLYSHMRALDVHVEEYTPARALSGRFHILHLHWPDRRVRAANPIAAAVRSAALLALLRAAHARGMKIVWTVHNLQAHEGTHHQWLEPRYWRSLTHMLDGFISLSQSGIAKIRAHFPALHHTPGFFVPHGHFRGVYRADVDRTEARRRLGIAQDARVVAFVGQVRPYKQVAELTQTFRSLADPRAVLLIAGRTRPRSLGDEIAALAHEDQRIRFVPQFIPDDDVQLYLRAADLVVLPYRDIFNSGSAVLALSYDRPLLVPAMGAMTELADLLGRAWVRTYHGALTVTELESALSWAGEERAEPAPLDELDWNHVARLTVAAYRALLT